MKIEFELNIKWNNLSQEELVDVCEWLNKIPKKAIIETKTNSHKET